MSETAGPGTAATSGAGAAPPARPGSSWRWLRDLVVVVLVALLVSWGVRTFLVRSFYIPSASMEDTLMIDDRVIVNELVPDLVGLDRGDVVVFHDPGGWLPGGAVGGDDELIKRVVGLPGDTVSCCDAEGRMLVNGEPVDEPYLADPDGPASTIPFDVTVPEGAIWVMGDNRAHSADSRLHQSGPYDGFVPLDHVVGRAFVIVWPVSRWGGL